MHIHQLTLPTPGISNLLPFYSERLGFGIREEGRRHFSLLAGRTLLTFRESPAPAYYHFAFNIPSNQIEAARSWLQDRTALLSDGGQTIIDFSNWNAKAVYFEDPAGNIVEFIARRDLGQFSSAPFSAAAIESVSEIGLPVEKVGQTFLELRRHTGIDRYWGDDTQFCAAGDEYGLFIIVDQATKTWYPTDRPARTFPLQATFSEQGERYRLAFSDGQLSVEQDE